MKPTVIVIGSADVIKLGIIRSVGELGYKVISIHLVGSSKAKLLRMKPLDYYSKYVSAYYSTTADNLIDLLINKCSEKDHKPVIFASDDKSVYLIDQSYHILNNYFLYANVNHQEGGIIHLMNKSIQKKMAAEAGLNVAKGWEIPFVNGNYVIPDDIEFPCFVKGELGYGGGKNLQKVCYDKRELSVLLDDNRRGPALPLLAEEYLPIDKEVGFMGISGEEYSKVPVMIEKTETGKGTSSGVTMAGRIVFVEESDKTTQAINRLLLSMGYSGISNLDFIVSQGKLYFLEVNFRYAAYGYGVFRAGVNLPAMFAESVESSNLNSIGLQIAIDNDYYYLNEKIGIINVLEKSITWAKYKELKKKADFLMVKSKDDPKPYRMFLFKMAIKYLKSVN